MQGTRKENKRRNDRRRVSIDLFGSLGVWFGDSQRCRRGLGANHVLAPKHRGISLDVDEETQTGTPQDGTAQNGEGILVSKLTESHTESNGARIAIRSDNTRNGSSAGGST